jgi:hypothetical protein
MTRLQTKPGGRVKPLSAALSALVGFGPALGIDGTAFLMSALEFAVVEFRSVGLSGALAIALFVERGFLVRRKLWSFHGSLP